MECNNSQKCSKLEAELVDVDAMVELADANAANANVRMVVIL
jgi:hypothetical protein